MKWSFLQKKEIESKRENRKRQRAGGSCHATPVDYAGEIQYISFPLIMYLVNEFAYI